VYLVIIMLSPWTAAAHRRWGIAVPLVMVAGVAVADSQAFVRNSGAPLAANLLLVWLIPHQLGYFYADGTLRRLSVKACAAMAATGLVMLAVLTSLPCYPRSLINPRWTVLTMDAPMLSLVASGLWLTRWSSPWLPSSCSRPRWAPGWWWRARVASLRCRRAPSATTTST
jgi:hypothetical protein